MPKPTDTEQVTELIMKLDENIRPTVQAIRELVLHTDPLIAEQVKWNSASFYYKGAMQPFDPKEYKRDILVCNVHRGKILLVFPTGAKVNIESSGKDYPDGRKILTLTDPTDLTAFKNEIVTILNSWLLLLEK